MGKRYTFIALILAIVLFTPLIYSGVKVNNTASRNFHNCSKFEGNEISIIFRNDDISMNTDIKKEREVLSVFSKYGIKPIYAVVPMSGGELLNNNDSVILFLKNALDNDQIVLALHGLDHKRNKYNRGEFGGLPYNVQYERIKTGKNLIDSLLNTEVIIFAPPWNVADKNTVKASLANGISCFSGYLYDPFVKEVNYLPVITNLFDGPLGSLSDVFYSANSNNSPKTLSVLFHSSYDFDKDSLYKLDSLLSKLHSHPRVVFPDPENIMSNNCSYLNQINAKYASFFDLSWQYSERSKPLIRITKYLSLFDFDKKRKIISNGFREGIIKGEEIYDSKQSQNIFRLGLYFLLLQRFLLLIALIIYLNIFSKSQLINQRVLIAVLLLLIIVTLIFIFPDMQFVSKPFLSEIFLSLVIVAGILLYILSSNRTNKSNI
jgi:hypothetical protein